MRQRYSVGVRLRKRGRVRRLYLRKRGGYTTVKLRGARGVFTKTEVVKARAWAKRAGHGFTATMINPYPFLKLNKTTRPVVASLMGKLNSLGRRLGRQLYIAEGTRTREQQQAFWDAFVRRGYAPPLVARPGTSNHEPQDGLLGRAADVRSLSGNVNVGSLPGSRVAMRSLGLCLPVPGEAWHVEEGHRWEA